MCRDWAWLLALALVSARAAAWRSSKRRRSRVLEPDQGFHQPRRAQSLSQGPILTGPSRTRPGPASSSWTRFHDSRRSPPRLRRRLPRQAWSRGPGETLQPELRHQRLERRADRGDPASAIRATAVSAQHELTGELSLEDELAELRGARKISPPPWGALAYAAVAAPAPLSGTAVAPEAASPP